MPLLRRSERSCKIAIAKVSVASRGSVLLSVGCCGAMIGALFFVAIFLFFIFSGFLMGAKERAQRLSGARLARRKVASRRSSSSQGERKRAKLRSRGLAAALSLGLQAVGSPWAGCERKKLDAAVAVEAAAEESLLLLLPTPRSP